MVNYAGALFGGWLSGYLVTKGWRPASARIRVVGIVAALQWVNLLIPHAPGPALATLGISASYALAAMFGVNFYTIPVDRYGHGAAAFSVSLLTSAFGLLSAFISPWIGRTIESSGFTPVCILAALSPMFAYAIVQFTRPAEER
jgi:ACS family hexuronate transporter-like MFS transporter